MPSGGGGVVKPIWMSWKTYAKKLEVDIRQRKEKHTMLDTPHLDRFLNATLGFPTIEALLQYLKDKSELNAQIVCRTISVAESAIPTDTITKETIIKMRDVHLFEEKLRGYLLLKDGLSHD
jgi:hypothetical protein